MKKLLITLGLVMSASLLGACSNTSTPTTPQTAPDALEALSGDETTTEIKDMISTRKEELKTETGTKNELTEKDVKLLEAITDKLSKKK